MPQRIALFIPLLPRPNYCWLFNTRAIVASARTADKARISATIYQEGAPAFEFNVGHLEWK
jgi:hypothetical protein